MTTKAINAQGSILAIEGGTPVAISDITAITKASAAVVSSLLATVAVGDLVRFGEVAGMPEIAGMLGMVTAATAGASFTVNIDTSGFATAGTTGEAEALTMVAGCEVKTFSGLDGQANEIDVTTLCSTAREFLMGLQDFGQFQMELNYVPDDAFQVECKEAKGLREKRAFSLLLPPGENGKQFEIVFDAFVRQFSISGGVDQAVAGSITLRVTGEPMEVEVTP
jgi:hypothetical protein